MVYLTGDTHGDIDRFRHGRLRWLSRRDTVVVLGDFGFVWDGSKEEQKKLDWLRKRPYTLLFLDGWLIPFVFLASIGAMILLNLGTNYFLGEISYITKALSAVLQLAVTMDYSIFLWHSYNEQREKHSDND